jgi:hypothetical protein
MEDFFAFIAIVFALVISSIGSIFTISWANDKWTCSEYPGNTKMIAGTCYIQENNKWITLSTYIHNVQDITIRSK